MVVVVVALLLLELRCLSFLQEQPELDIAGIFRGRPGTDPPGLEDHTIQLGTFQAGILPFRHRQAIIRPVILLGHHGTMLIDCGPDRQPFR